MPDPALDNSGRLGQFLDRTIAELKPKPMNKFAELAAKIKVSQATMNDEADKLSAEVDAIGPEFMAAVDMHRSILSDARAGVQAMKDAANQLSNGAPNESKT